MCIIKIKNEEWYLKNAAGMPIMKSSYILWSTTIIPFLPQNFSQMLLLSYFIMFQKDLPYSMQFQLLSV